MALGAERERDVFSGERLWAHICKNKYIYIYVKNTKYKTARIVVHHSDCQLVTPCVPRPDISVA